MYKIIKRFSWCSEIKDVGSTLSMIRNAMGIKQKDLAAYADVSQPNISRLEKGTQPPTLSFLERVAHGLHQKVYVLFISSGGEEVMKKMDEIISGGISGAITDPFSEQADVHAKIFYEEMRHNHSDVARIAKNTGLSVEDVLHVKNFLFIDLHSLADGEIRRFDESFAIAESWRRLAFDPEHIQKHDLILLKHELYERKLIAQGLTQRQAHEKASQEYDYPREMQAFYNELTETKVIPKRKDFDAGAIKYTDFVR